MKLVVCDPQNIAAWIFPEAMPDFPEPGVAVDVPRRTDDDFLAFVKAIDNPQLERDLAAPLAPRCEPLRWDSSGCDVGFPHDAPDCVLYIKP